MTSLTEVRQSLKEALGEIENVGIKVGAAASEYQSPIQQFGVCVLVGAPSEAAEERLDQMLAPEGPDSVKAALEADRAVAVSKHSGYRLYPQPEGKPLLGAEWTVDVLI